MPYIEDTEGSEADVESDVATTKRPTAHRSPVRSSRGVKSSSGDPRRRRASSTDTMRPSFGLLPTGDLHLPSKEHQSRREPSTASADNTGDEWREPDVHLPSHYNLVLRPTKAQLKFLRRKDGYNGFYHQQSFDMGVEPYGYPDKELPAFLGGEMPDRISHVEWLSRQNRKKPTPRKSTLTEGLGNAEGVEIGGSELVEGRRRMTRGADMLQPVAVEEEGLPVIQTTEDAA